MTAQIGYAGCTGIAATTGIASQAHVRGNARSSAARAAVRKPLEGGGGRAAH